MSATDSSAGGNAGTKTSGHESLRVPWTVIISAYLVPVMIVAQFAWLATVPVLILLVSTFRNARSHVLRGLAVLLTVVYATPYAIWKLRPDPAPSLSKDMDPAFAALIIATSVVFIVTIHVIPRTGSRPA